MVGSGAPNQPSLGPGYTVVRELGGGGMSRVFVAREHALGREIVVKVLARELSESLSAARFAREIRLAAGLQEPHIVPVHTAGETLEGLPYYTMPFVRGQSLRARIDGGRLPREEAIGILRDVARALHYAHSQGVIHRDIKPENILLSSGTAMVTDFGIAKAISAARADAQRTSDASVLTSFGISVGTPAYMSPEQAAGVPDVDYRADLYAWGIVAWELLGARHPFAHCATVQRLIAAHISESPAPLHDPLAALVMRCLEKDPGARPVSAAEILTELDDKKFITSGVRGPSRRTAFLAAAMTMLAVVVAGAVWSVRGGRSAESSRVSRSVGVTPFVNLSGDRANDYFSEGVTQEIAGALGRVPGLRVAIGPLGRTAAEDPRELGRALNVETVLRGTVQRDGDRVRVTARLVNTDDGFQVWTEKFDREYADVFALQDDVARSIARGLQLALAPEGRDTLVRASTSDPEAHNLYLQGMYFWNRRGSANIYKSVERFKQALDRDPGFARAWAGIALAYAVLVTWDDVDVTKTLNEAIHAANKALALDSATAEAWTAIAEAKSKFWRNAEATAAFEKAIALDPNNATAHQWYGEHLSHTGRTDEGLAHVRRAQQLAPLSLAVNIQEGRLELHARRFEKAKAAILRVVDLDSTYSTAHTLLGATYLQQRVYDHAISSFRRAIALSGERRTPDIAFLAHAYVTAGRRDSAVALLAELEEKRMAHEPVSFAGLALVLQSLGDTDRAVAMLDTAVMRHDAILSMHSPEAVFDPLRGDARGAKILSRAEGPR